MIVVSLTDVGKMRKNNQDVPVCAEGLYGVADGMGGHKGGEVASAGARDVLLGVLKGKKPSAAALGTGIEAANRRLFLRQKEESELAGMGTTLTVLWPDEKNVYIGHVGDSRAYRLRGDEWKQITRDHSVVQELMEHGVLTAEQAAHHPMRNIITRAVGTEESVEVDTLTETRRKGDVWLVCTDGLHGMVDDAFLRDTLKDNPPKEAAKKLMQGALDAGGRDNITFVILKDEEEHDE